MTGRTRGRRTASGVRHPLFARFFVRSAPRKEQRGQAELRREMLAGLSGWVVEVGAGSGLNFTHYPAAVRGVIAVVVSRVLCSVPDVPAAITGAGYRICSCHEVIFPPGSVFSPVATHIIGRAAR